CLPGVVPWRNHGLEALAMQCRAGRRSAEAWQARSHGPGELTPAVVGGLHTGLRLRGRRVAEPLRRPAFAQILPLAAADAEGATAVALMCPRPTIPQAASPAASPPRAERKRRLWVGPSRDRVAAGRAART